LAFTKNFTSSTRKWLFPTCNVGKSCWERAIAIDPADPNVVFSGTEHVERGVISSDIDNNLSVTWTQITNNPESNGWDFMRFYTDAALTNTIVVTFSRLYDDPGTMGIDSKKGGIYLYNATTGATIHSGLIDKPVRGTAIISSSLIYTAVEYANNFEDPDPEDRGVYRSTDGGATWLATSGGDLAEYSGIKLFAYDKTRDILYGAIESSGYSEPSRSKYFYRLESASAGGSNWIASTDESSRSAVYAIGIDPSDGTLYASRSNAVYKSSDKGQTWELYYTGLNNEEFNVLSVQPAAIESSSLATIRSSDTNPLVVGGSLGLKLIEPNAEATPTPVPTVTPTPPPTATPANTLKCQLTVAAVCKGKVKKNTSCKLSAKVKKLNNKVLKGVRVNFQREQGNASWKNFAGVKTDTLGVSKSKIKSNKTLRVRISVNSDQNLCTSDPKRITVKSAAAKSG
jgi:hypothetical protein